MLKYKAIFSSISPSIEEIIVEKETEKCVWVNGSKLLKDTEYHRVYNTKEEAKEKLQLFYINKIKKAQAEIMKMKDNIKSLDAL